MENDESEGFSSRKEGLQDKEFAKERNRLASGFEASIRKSLTELELPSAAIHAAVEAISESLAETKARLKGLPTTLPDRDEIPTYNARSHESDNTIDHYERYWRPYQSAGLLFSMISKTHLGCSTARNKGTCDNRLSIKRSDVEASVLGALKVHLMDEELCSEFCREYTRHQNEIRSRHNAALNGYRQEMEQLKRDQEKLVQSILDGVPGSALKDRGEYIVQRKEELETILATTEEAPVLFHPSMAERYHQEVARLIEALNSEAHRQEAADLLRKLIDKIELQPVAGDDRLAIDLHGDLAGILSVATQSDRRLVEGGLSYIKPSRQDDSGSAEVASQEALVAGVGFEPTTFRL